MENILKFITSFIFVAVTAALSSYLSYLGIDTFYDNLTLPPLNPPNGIFKFVWPVLYVLMIVSFYMVLEKENNMKAVKLFIYQILLHILWCYLFFAKGLFMFGFIDIVLLDITVFMMIKEFGSLNPIAGYLEYPYFLWLLFATYLNAGVWYLNGASVAM